MIIRFLTALSLAAIATHAQDHGHLHVGAESQTAGSKLIFTDGAIFATTSGYVKTLVFTDTGAYAGYYHGNITVTGLATTPERGGPEPQAASPGTVIYAQLTKVEGPAGGEFSFWETGATSPTITVRPGETGAQMWRVTEADGSPGLDPYGHIHGRRFTLNKPGVYKITLRAHDLSTNGPAGGPIHAPSDEITIYFQAGVNIFAVAPTLDGTTIRFAAIIGQVWQVESTEALTPPIQWQPVGDSITGNDLIQDVLDVRQQASQRYYRIRRISP